MHKEVHSKLAFVVAACGAADVDQIHQHIGVRNAFGALFQNLLRVVVRRLVCDGGQDHGRPTVDVRLSFIFRSCPVSARVPAALFL